MLANHGLERQPSLSIVIPITLPKLYSRLTCVLSKSQKGCAHEIVFVNDGGTDGSMEILAKLNAEDPAVKVLDLSRNFGHQAALTAGLDNATGDAVICMDGDLQDPPAVIPLLIAKWYEGYDVVYAIRNARKEGLLKRACYSIFYGLLGKVAMIAIPLKAGDFALLDRRVVNCLKAMPERSRFIRGLRAWMGFQQIGIAYERDKRFTGAPKYTWPKLMKLAVDGLLSFAVVYAGCSRIKETWQPDGSTRGAFCVSQDIAMVRFRRTSLR